MQNPSFWNCLQPAIVKYGPHQNLLLWLMTDQDTSRYIVSRKRGIKGQAKPDRGLQRKAKYLAKVQYHVLHGIIWSLSIRYQQGKRCGINNLSSIRSFLWSPCTSCFLTWGSGLDRSLVLSNIFQMLRRSVSNISKRSASKERKLSKLRYKGQEGKKLNLKKRNENSGLKSEEKE